MPSAMSYNALMNEALETLHSEVGLDNQRVDSKTRLLLSLPMRKLADLWNDLEERDRQLALASAFGEGLDAFGDFLHTPRKTATVGITSAAGFRIWRETPSATSVTIPANTQVWVPGKAGDYFLTTNSVTLGPGSQEAMTGLRAPRAGSYYTAAPYTITTGQFPAGIYCTNLDAIAGADMEKDDAYRYRLSLARIGNNKVNRGGIIGAMLALPGIDDVRILSARRGAGTTDVLVYTSEPIPRPATLEYLQRLLDDELVAEGISGRVIGPVVRKIDLTLRVSFAASVSAANRQFFRQKIVTTLQDYLNTRDLGEPVYIDRLQYLALAASPQVIDVEILAMSVDDRPRVPDALFVEINERPIAGRIQVN